METFTLFSKKNTAKLLTKDQIYLISLTSLYLLINGILYTNSYHEIHTLWTTAGDQDAGYLLLAIAFFYSIKNVRHITSRKVSRWLLPAFLLLSLTHYTGQFFDIKTFRLLVLVIGWPFFLGLIMGKELFFRLLLPTMLIVMALPAWYLLIPLLQLLTVHATTFGLSLLNIPIFIENNFIYIPNGIIHVAEGCSGLKYFQSAIALSIIMNLFHKSHWRNIFILGACSALLAILANWIRVIILVLVGHYSGLDNSLMTDHDNLGWIIFAAALVPMIFIDRKLSIKPYAEKKTTTKGLALEKIKPLSIIVACLCISLPALFLTLFPFIN